VRLDGEQFETCPLPTGWGKARNAIAEGVRCFSLLAVNLIGLLIAALAGAILTYIVTGSLQASSQKRHAAIQAKLLWVEMLYGYGEVPHDWRKRYYLAAAYSLAAGDAQLYELFISAGGLNFDFHKAADEAESEDDPERAQAARERRDLASNSENEIMRELIPPRLDPLLVIETPTERFKRLLRRLRILLEESPR
jgi:hypothetical protein